LKKGKLNAATQHLFLYVNWLLKNSLLGSILTIFLGENWIEEKPRLVAVVKIILSLILLLGALGFVIALIN